ncbi:MAG: alpha-hydroxy-acid oxidizing protein [Rhodobacteraceae bacterium]|jgi:L-lactate dehydrogenase (cytochrome)|nr:alpha-hydroxy-acid oxidizing protein [Paracoccaceae bacterium]
MTATAPAGGDRIGRRNLAAIPRRFRSILSLDDFEVAARRRLPRPLFGYVRGGVEDERSLQGAAAAYDDYVFLPRYFAGVADVSTAATLLGEVWSAPFGIAPMGICAINGYRADVALARAAGRNGIPMIISGASLIALEAIMDEYPRAWFQAYLPPTTEKMRALLDRARGAGVATVVITVDSPVGSNRENNLRAGFSSPLRPSLRLALDGLVRPRWLVGTFLRTLMTHGMPHFENLYAHRGAPIVSRTVQREFGGRAHFAWEHFRDIRRMWTGRLVVKGILHPGDARQAVAEGTDALIVSNHGGRQLDCTIAPLHALPAVREAAPAVPVMLDGGIRRGTQAVKALALGADFVFCGRPFNYAAAIGGEAGVEHAIAILKGEIQRTMAQVGVRRVEDVDPARVVARGIQPRNPSAEELERGHARGPDNQ